MFHQCNAPNITAGTIIGTSLNQIVRYIQYYLPGSSSKHEHQRIQKGLSILIPIHLDIIDYQISLIKKSKTPYGTTNTISTNTFTSPAS